MVGVDIMDIAMAIMDIIMGITVVVVVVAVAVTRVRGVGARRDIDSKRSPAERKRGWN